MEAVIQRLHLVPAGKCGRLRVSHLVLFTEARRFHRETEFWHCNRAELKSLKRGRERSIGQCASSGTSKDLGLKESRREAEALHPTAGLQALKSPGETVGDSAA